MSRVWDESLNPYQILELEDGYKSTAEQIKKAYRNLARQKHPDKNPKAKVEEFHLIQTAYEILCDVAAKEAYDNVFKAKDLYEEKWQKQSEKRRRMREDLERKEKASFAEKRAYEATQAALVVELDRIRRKLENEHKQKTQTSRTNSQSNQDLSKMVKIKWEDKEIWTEERLKTTLCDWVGVKSIVLRCKRKRFYSAIAELSVASDVQKLITHQQEVIQRCEDGISNAELLKWTLTPFPVLQQEVADVSWQRGSLNEDEVLAKMSRISANR